jgi:hypothetical protein
VIAFGIAISTVLGRFVIPIYYILGERIRDRGTRPSPEPELSHPVTKVPLATIAATTAEARLCE